MTDSENAGTPDELDGSIEGGAGLRDLSGDTGKDGPVTRTPSDLDSLPSAPASGAADDGYAVLHRWMKDDAAADTIDDLSPRFGHAHRAALAALLSEVERLRVGYTFTKNERDYFEQSLAARRAERDEARSQLDAARRDAHPTETPT